MGEKPVKWWVNSIFAGWWDYGVLLLYFRKKAIQAMKMHHFYPPQPYGWAGSENRQIPLFTSLRSEWRLIA